MFGWLSSRGAAGTARPQAPAPTDIDPQALQQALAAPRPPLLLDVRSPGEYAEGHIPGARLIPLPQLGGRIGELPTDRPIVCVCRSGGRSGVATHQLRARGLQVRNMRGGMLQWHGPVATGPAD